MRARTGDAVRDAHVANWIQALSALASLAVAFASCRIAERSTDIAQQQADYAKLQADHARAQVDASIAQLDEMISQTNTLIDQTEAAKTQVAAANAQTELMRSANDVAAWGIDDTLKLTRAQVAVSHTQTGLMRTANAETRRGIDESLTLTRRQTELSAEQTELSRDQTHSVRAWISIPKASLPGNPEVGIVIENNGQTPATRLEMRSAWQYLGPGEQGLIRKYDSINPTDFGTIGPGGHINYIYPKTKKPGPGEGLRLVLHGRIDYCDIFGRVQWTEFCLEHDAKDDTFSLCSSFNNVKLDKRGEDVTCDSTSKAP
jgi:hypothetical protein